MIFFDVTEHNKWAGIMSTKAYVTASRIYRNMKRDFEHI